MSDSLYKIVGEFKEIQEMIEDPETDEQAFMDTLESIDWQQRFEQKADAYKAVMDNLDFQIAELEGKMQFLQGKITELKAKADAKEKLKSDMLDRLTSAMKETGHEKFRTDEYSFYIKRTPRVEITEDVREIPARFLRQADPLPDKAKIKKELDEGGKLPFAHLEYSERVMIR